jgi:hypothetical protein
MSETEIQYLKDNLKFWALVIAAIGAPWAIIYIIL